jgi:hypothetical protein
VLSDGAYHELFISAGNVYLQTLATYEALSAVGLRAQVATGPPGCRLAALRAWLYSGSEA